MYYYDNKNKICHWKIPLILRYFQKYTWVINGKDRDEKKGERHLNQR